MLSLTCFNRSFTPNWWLSLLALLVFALFMRLGFWQLSRAEVKSNLIAAEHFFSKQGPIYWAPDDKMPELYQSIKVSGYFLPFLILLDNQHYQHQFGYHVFSPLVLANQSLVLVDRGWIAGDVTRQSLPKIKTPSQRLELSGQVYYPAEKTFALGSFLEKETGNLAVVEWMDAQLISHLLQKSFHPFIIRLNINEEHGFVREWPIVPMSPERHYGYALQWFSFALVIFILFIALNLKKKR